MGFRDWIGIVARPREKPTGATTEDSPPFEPTERSDSSAYPGAGTFDDLAALGLLYPDDVTTSPHFDEALTWVTVEDLQPSDPLHLRCDHAAWIDEAAFLTVGASGIMAIAAEVGRHPLVEETIHAELEVLYVRAPGLTHEDVQLLTAAAIAERVPDPPPSPPLPAPVAAVGPRRYGTSGAVLGLAGLVIAAFVAGIWWSGRGEPTAATTVGIAAEAAVAEPAPGPPEATPSSAAATTTSALTTTTTTTPVTTPPEVIVIDQSTVIEAALEALTAAGYQDVSASYDDGTLVLEGVVAPEVLGSGYFSFVAGVTEAVSGLEGVEAVSTRLFLRGDDAALRAELRAISEATPIEFPFASAELSAESVAALEQVAEAILANPGLRVLVAGHTDAVGSPETNAELAAARAGAVIRRLIELGVPVTRLQPVAYGELFPGEGQSDAQKRRVEFEVAP